MSPTSYLAAPPRGSIDEVTRGSDPSSLHVGSRTTGRTSALLPGHRPLLPRGAVLLGLGLREAHPALLPGASRPDARRKIFEPADLLPGERADLAPLHAVDGEGGEAQAAQLGHRVAQLGQHAPDQSVAA